jgi:hypothetical protein
MMKRTLGRQRGGLGFCSWKNVSEHRSCLLWEEEKAFGPQEHWHYWQEGHYL